MMPAGPLMIEHRLIERMISLLDHHVTSISSPELVDLALIEQAIDFLRNYADICHHGKEEDILFRELRVKPLTNQQQAMLDELLQEHRLSRATIKNLDMAREQALHGDKNVYKDIIDAVGTLTRLYPIHIAKEDQEFFIPAMSYFSAYEQSAMLQEFADFDQRLIHQKYRLLVESLEAAPRPAGSPQPTAAADASVYECTVCGYHYDPALGDPEHGFPAGTSFADLPEEWVCPVCGASKDLFQKVA